MKRKATNEGPAPRRRKYVKRNGRKRTVYASIPVGISKAYTPFKDVGEMVGSKLGGLVGMPGIGASALGTVGNVIGKTLFGSGDYNDNFQMVNLNSLINPNAQQTPMIDSMTNSGGFNLKRREYIGDIISNATANTFDVKTYPINPGQLQSFPYLSALARNFEEYKMNGLVYHFKSLSADALNSVQTGLGYVAMATQYDAYDPDFTTKAQIENYSFSQSGRPSHDQMHGVECMQSQNVMNHRYIRIGTQPDNSDLRLFDIGKFSIATSCPGTSVTLGELWVSYDIDFYKPKLPETGGASASSRVGRTNAATTAITFGSTGVPSQGSITPASASATAISFVGLPTDVTFIMVAVWTLASGGSFSTTPSFSTGGVNQNLFGTGLSLDQTHIRTSPTGGVIAVTAVTVKPSSAGEFNLAISNGTSATSVTFTFDLFITPIDAAIQ